MTSRDFCYWLQGYFEVLDPDNENAKVTAGDDRYVPYIPLGPKQIKCIREHLALVFKHEIDPSMGGPKHQAELDALHGQKPGGPVFRC
jgi:hypothetical protein